MPLDMPLPLDAAVYRVYAEAEKLDASLSELLILPRERDELGGTHWREVAWAAEQQPLPVVAEAPLAPCPS
jgi:hypothetical protein